MYTIYIEQHDQTVQFVTSDLDHAIGIAEDIEKIHTPRIAHVKIYEHMTRLVYWIEIFSHAPSIVHRDIRNSIM